jgi:hypothetical protein
VIKVGIGLTIGSAGLTVVLVEASTSDAKDSSANFANCDLGIGGVPGFVAAPFVFVLDGATDDPLNDGAPPKSAKKSHQALSTDVGSLWYRSYISCTNHSLGPKEPPK